MSNTTVPDEQTAAEDRTRPLVDGITAYVTRRTPVRVSGPAGIRSAELRFGPNHEILLRADTGTGDRTRLLELLHLEGFLAHALVAVRLALREEADHIDGQALVAGGIEIAEADKTKLPRRART